MKNYIKEFKSSLSDTFLDEKGTGLCLYPLKTPENQWCSRGIEKSVA